MIDVEQLLAGPAVASLGTIEQNGLPHIVPVWVHLVGDRVLIPTSSHTIKARNVTHTARAGLMVHEASGPMQLRGVLIQGEAQILRGAETRARNRAIHERYLDGADLTDPRISSYLAQDDVTLAVALDRVRTWDLGEVVGSERGN